ncbi:MAG: hypothetical protein BMS9Abin13_196 [Patescibacteria group bacterium]|nr:MAG: hypothetical protein BMS9Abin13_196 [Patescibacteria group bacterium]
MLLYPSDSKLLFYLSKKNYWVFLPRYRGTWESDGSFLAKPPHIDIIDMIDELPKGFKDLWSGEVYKIRTPEIYIIGSSFGGTVAILAAKDKRVRRSVAFSPAINWRIGDNPKELDWLESFTKSAYGNGYRFRREDWNKLRSGKLYDLMAHVDKLDPKKLFIIHARDDKVVYSRSSEQFSEELGCKFWELDRGGHFFLSEMMNPMFSRKIFRFLKAKS